MKIRNQKGGADADLAPRDPDAATPGQEPNKAPGALIRMERQVQDAISNDTVEGRNANRRVAILVLESVAPGAPVTARSHEQPPAQSSSNVAIADAASGENRLLWRTQPAELSKTVLMNDPAKTAAVKDSVNDASPE